MRNQHDDDDEHLGRRTKIEKPFVIKMSRVNTALDIKLEPLLANVLNDVHGLIRIDIGADNFARVIVVDEESGNKIGTLKDIERIAKFRRFIEEEKKITKNLDILGPIEGRLVNAFKGLIAQKDWVDLTFPTISATQLVVLKESERKTRRLEANRDFLVSYMKERKFAPHEEDICIQIHSWVIGSLEANAKLYEWVLTGADSVNKMSDELFAQVVPAWAYKRLSQMNLTLLTDMRRVVFPQNTRAGVQFTVKELMNDGFRNRHIKLLSHSGFQIRLLHDGAGLKTVLNLPEIPNLKDSKSLKLQDLEWLVDFPILVSPAWFGIEYLFEPKAKGKIPDFDPPKYSTPQSTLKSIVHAIVSMQVFEFRTDQQIGEVWDKLSFGLGINGIFREGITARNNLYRVALTKKEVLSVRVQGVIECHGRSAKEFMAIRTRAQLKTTTGSSLEKIIFKHLGIDNITRKESFIGPLQGPPPERRPYAYFFDALSEPIGTADFKLASTVRKNIGIRKTADIRADKQYGVTVTPLSHKAVDVMEGLKKNRSVASLVPGIENWLRSFIHENFQRAGLKQIQLNLEELVVQEEDAIEVEDLDDIFDDEG